MPLSSISLRWGRRWWWIFALLIAVPALALAVLGLRVAQLERLERAQQTREQQAQLARLTDTALTNTFAAIQSDLGRAEDSPAALRNYPVFVLDRDGKLVFWRDKTYFPDPGKPPARPGPQWTPQTEQLIERAQAAEAQQKSHEAAALFEQVGKAEPRLKTWSELELARLQLENGDLSRITALADPAWIGSDGVTPGGMPVILLVAEEVEGVHPAQRARFIPLLQATLEGLRAGRWWFDFEERRFYDQEVRRLLELAGSRPTGEDPRLAEWAAIERIVRRAGPNEGRSLSDIDGAMLFLILWSRQQGGNWSGAAIPGRQLGTLIDSALHSPFSNQPFSAMIRRAKGSVIWKVGARDQPMTISIPLRVVPGWELFFSAPGDRGWLDPRRVLWYGFTLMVVLTLGVGVAVTVYVVRREAELSRLQSEFVAGVTHEFKSPITSIRLLIERLASGRVKNPISAGEYHDAINRETERLERLVNRVLESQKIQSGEKRYSFVLGSLVGVVESSIWRLRPQADAKSIGVDLELAGEIPEIRMDKTAVSEALDNLIDNAIKYSPEGARIVIRVEKRRNGLCVEVEDEGIGIDPEDLPRIFDKFYRGRRGDRQNVRGTGLGLALVKAAAEGHGGSVEATSAPGQGARFCLRLPLER